MRFHIDSHDELDKFNSPIPSDSLPAAVVETSPPVKNSPTVSILRNGVPIDPKTEEMDADDSLASADDTYDCMTRTVVNNSNLVTLDVGRNAWSAGAQRFWELVNCSTERGLKTLIIYALHSMTDRVKAGKEYESFKETLSWEESFLFNNDSIERLLADSTDGRPLNDAFRAYTGIEHMVSGLKTVCSPSDDVSGAVNIARYELRQKVIRYLKEKGRTIPLPNMQYYGESMRRFNAVDIVAMGAFIQKDPAEFVTGARTLDKFEHRNLPSQFIIPRFDKAKPGIKDKFLKIRFGTDRDPQIETISTEHGIFVRF